MLIEKNIELTPPKSILDEDDFKEMISEREIKPEDFEIIEKLSSFPKNIFIDYHNYFLFSKENTLRDLKHDLQNYQNELEKIRQFNNQNHINSLEKRIAFLRLFVEFAKRYDWCVCNNLNRVFERRKIKK
ncbi:MAG: hypothetical protein JW870_14530 [Candidatus Delongbacteria bacterium]|nr:hypothetical protein [Candidatus Delongbacteria bacterium]